MGLSEVRPHIWTFLPYYFLVIGATVVLCWLASIGVVSPIRRIAASIALFGQGNLSVCVKSRRQDELGNSAAHSIRWPNVSNG